MKSIIIILLALSSIIGGKAFSQSGENFELKGNIEGLKNESNIYLLLDSEDGLDTVLSVKSNKSSFIFKGHVNGNANYYFLGLDSSMQKGVSNALWLTNVKMSLTGKINEFDKLSLQGSEPHDEYTTLRELHSKVQFKPGEIDTLMSFINRHPNSLYISDLIIKVGGGLDEYNNLSDRAKQSYWGKELEKFTQTLKGVGDKIEFAKLSNALPNFSFTDLNGNKQAILEIAAQNKYTLIDFWASWCSPCRAAIPELKKVYDAFHSKGFNIIGISTDKSVPAWKKAVREDKTPWTHGLDNIEIANKNIFRILGIPSYIIIDKNGKIIQSELIAQVGPNSSGAAQIKTFKDKTVDGDLFEMIETLLKAEKGK